MTDSDIVPVKRRNGLRKDLREIYESRNILRSLVSKNLFGHYRNSVLISSLGECLATPMAYHPMGATGCPRRMYATFHSTIRRYTNFSNVTYQFSGMLYSNNIGSDCFQP
ncbi:hypothetical protein [Methanomethylophilus alvi]|uniref:hypothetical protein n=1 Tax=Methanomethylophilus alvi TaxID=1291540 RepID=UPI0037DDBB81